jgi:YbbR domain-containing protein
VKIRPRYPFQFLLSLLVAFLLWYGLAAQRGREMSIRGVRAQLTLVNIPRDLVLTSSVPDSVALQLRGSLSRALDPRNPLEVLLDLSDARPGTNSYPINGGDITVPPEVEVVSVEPSAITLELERRQTLNLAVQVIIEGVPAPGFVIGEFRTMPATLRVQGPEGRLAELEFVETAPVSVEGATAPVEASVQPVLSDPLLRVLSVAPIQVVVDVQPEPTPTPES